MFVVAPGTCLAETTAKLFHTHMVKYFGFLEDNNSDRDTHFMGRFYTVVFNLIGSELKFSTTDHP